MQYTLQYEGDWVQGRREGEGTRWYLNGESYSGAFVANIRHGQGRYEFVNVSGMASFRSDDVGLVQEEHDGTG